MRSGIGGMHEVETKKMVRGDCFPKLRLLAGLPKIMTHTLLNHLKETSTFFYFLRGKS